MIILFYNILRFLKIRATKEGNFWRRQEVFLLQPAPNQRLIKKKDLTILRFPAFYYQIIFLYWAPVYNFF